MDERPEARWQQRLVFGALAAGLLAGLALVVALALGWRNPRPTRAPDWTASGLPLTLEAPSGEDAAALLGVSGSDFTYEGEAVPLAGPDFNGYGLLYRAQDAAHGYVLAVGSDGYYAVLRLAGDEETTLVDWQQFPHVRRGLQANRLRVRCVGPVCEFFINDEIAASVTDTVWLEGQVGLWARSYEGEPTRIELTGARLWRETEGG